MQLNLRPEIKCELADRLIETRPLRRHLLPQWLSSSMFILSIAKNMFIRIVYFLKSNHVDDIIIIIIRKLQL